MSDGSHCLVYKLLMWDSLQHFSAFIKAFIKISYLCISLEALFRDICLFAGNIYFVNGTYPCTESVTKKVFFQLLKLLLSLLFLQCGRTILPSPLVPEKAKFCSLRCLRVALESYHKVESRINIAELFYAKDESDKQQQVLVLAQLGRFRATSDHFVTSGLTCRTSGPDPVNKIPA